MNNILNSYLRNRRQYVQLDTYCSSIIQSPDCSVVQGGKLSGLLYRIYINELPLIHKLNYDDQIIKPHIINKNKLPSHSTIQFVDDSSNVIGFKDDDIMKKYLENYTKILYDYYTCNKLKIN